MSSDAQPLEDDIVEVLFAEFNEILRTTGAGDYSILTRCPEELRTELCSLMNVALLAYRAFEPERRALEERAMAGVAN